MITQPWSQFDAYSNSVVVPYPLFAILAWTLPVSAACNTDFLNSTAPPTIKVVLGCALSSAKIPERRAREKRYFGFSVSGLTVTTAGRPIFYQKLRAFFPGANDGEPRTVEAGEMSKCVVFFRQEDVLCIMIGHGQALVTAAWIHRVRTKAKSCDPANVQ